MFLGQYRHNIDEKGRLTIPARFRELLENGGYVTQGFERNLMVLTTADFHNIADKVGEKSLTDPTARELKRLLFSTADPLDMDKSGRILLPQFLREFAGLDGEVVLVGVGDHFEIWPPEDWDKQINRLKDTEANAQRFSGVTLTAGRSSNEPAE